MAVIIKNLISNWFLVVKKITQRGLLADLVISWGDAKSYLDKYDYPAHHVRGIMSNLINLLTELGWETPSFNVWISPQGDEWELGGDNNPPHSCCKKCC